MLSSLGRSTRRQSSRVRHRLSRQGPPAMATVHLGAASSSRQRGRPSAGAADGSTSFGSSLRVAAAVTAAAVGAGHSCLAESHDRDDGDEDEHVFVNWSASHQCRPRALLVPESIDELEQLLQEHHTAGRKLRCMGAGVSPNGLGFSSSVSPTGDSRPQGPVQHESLLSMALFDRILEIDIARQQVTVEAGIVVGELLDRLRAHGLTMQNVASIRDQQVGGITQAGCHGTGARIPPIDDQVVAMEIVTPAQGRLRLSDTENPELFALAKCGLGALGVVTKVTLQCVPAYHLAEKTSVQTIDHVRRHHHEWLDKYMHLRYMWIPNTDAVVVVQCEKISADQAALGARAYPPPPHSVDSQLAEPRRLYLELAGEGADPEYRTWSFTKLRDKLLEFHPLDKAHVARVNQAEKAFWELNEGYRVGLSDDIIGFDCGGQQLVQEIAFPTTGTRDIDFVAQLLETVDAKGIPAPSPIEQRWTARSTSAMSPAASWNPAQVFCWVGIILYLPTPDEATRGRLWREFFDYHALLRDVMEPFGGVEHWAKIEWPREPIERERMRRRLGRRYPLDQFRAARDALDPHHILSNDIVDTLLSP